jgi:hypothetical protein
MEFVYIFIAALIVGISFYFFRKKSAPPILAEKKEPTKDAQKFESPKLEISFKDRLKIHS